MTLLLKQYKRVIDDALSLEFGEANKLQQAMRYALLSKGKRIRPIITLIVADALGNDLPVMQSALAVEFSHTASLIADDLPSMDDEKQRRGKKCLHAEFGEATAILASYALITAAFGKIESNGRMIKEERAPFCDLAYEATSKAISLASKASGHLGATLGQQLDLFEKPDSIESLENLIYLKTVTLFEVAMGFGWIFGGGDLGRIEEIKSAAQDLGMAFQIRDDIFDFKEDEKRGCMSNFAVMLGYGPALSRFFKETNDLREKLSSLGLLTEQFESLLSLLEGDL